MADKLKEIRWMSNRRYTFAKFILIVAPSLGDYHVHMIGVRVGWIENKMIEVLIGGLATSKEAMEELLDILQPTSVEYKNEASRCRISCIVPCGNWAMFWNCSLSIALEDTPRVPRWKRLTHAERVKTFRRLMG